MEKITNHYDFLLRLSKSKNSKKLIEGASREELDAVVECIRVCSANSDKCMKELSKLKSEKTIIRLLRKSKPVLRAIVAVVLMRIVNWALEYVQNG